MMRYLRAAQQTFSFLEPRFKQGLVFAAVVSSVASAGATTATATRTSLSVAAQAVSGGHARTVFTSHVTDANGNPITSGTVSFDSGTRSLGSSVVDGTGEATISVTSLPTTEGADATPVAAVYHPAAASNGTVSASSSVTANVHANDEGAPDFTVTATPATFTVASGDYATSVITVTPVNGLQDQITLSCSDLPAQGTCTFSPAFGTTDAGAFTSTLQLATQTSAGTSRLQPAVMGGADNGGTLALGFALPGLLGLGGWGFMRRRKGFTGSLPTALLFAGSTLALLGGIGLSGCGAQYGYKKHVPTQATGTLAGTYTITLAASGNNGTTVILHNLALTLTVTD